MYRSIKENVEDIKIQSFAEVKTKEDVMVSRIDELLISVPLSTSSFAIAAMLKGYYEHYLGISGDQENFDQEILKQCEHNLEVFKDVVKKAKTAKSIKESGIILP
jgi:hypothetical protein